MRKTLQCPQCDGKKLWRIETMREHGHHNVVHPLAVSLQRSFLRELDGLEHALDKGEHFIDTEPATELR